MATFKINTLCAKGNNESIFVLKHTLHLNLMKILDLDD